MTVWHHSDFYICNLNKIKALKYYYLFPITNQCFKTSIIPILALILVKMTCKAFY